MRTTSAITKDQCCPLFVTVYTPTSKIIDNTEEHRKGNFGAVNLSVF